MDIVYFLESAGDIKGVWAMSDEIKVRKKGYIFEDLLKQGYCAKDKIPHGNQGRKPSAETT